MTYEPIPFRIDQRRADVISRMLREIMKHETIFSDYAAECLKATESGENPCTALPLVDADPVKNLTFAWRIDPTN